MMSDYDGFDRPYPAWFPYFCLAFLVLGAAVYWVASASSAPPTSRTQEEMSLARNKPAIISKRRA